VFAGVVVAAVVLVEDLGDIPRWLPVQPVKRNRLVNPARMVLVGILAAETGMVSVR
jgi:hypothetical protein